MFSHVIFVGASVHGRGILYVRYICRMDKKLVEKILRLRCSGDSWKAREILSGRIGQQEYDPELYRLYGEVLLELGDTYAAGKFLFLGGSEQLKHKEAISIFLNRNKNHDAYGFFALMPKKFVKSDPARYPESVSNYINESGFKKKDLYRIQSRFSDEAVSLTIHEEIFFSSAAGLMIIAIIIGLWVIISTAYGWIVE